MIYRQQRYGQSQGSHEAEENSSSTAAGNRRIHANKQRWVQIGRRGHQGSKTVGNVQAVNQGGVIVGSVPCRIFPEDRMESWQGATKIAEESVDVTIHHQQKRLRVLSAEGREIVGPGISEQPKYWVNLAVGQASWDVPVLLQRVIYSGMLLSDKVLVQKRGNGGSGTGVSEAKPAGKQVEACEAGADRAVGKEEEPRWCPVGLSRTKKRRVQRLRRLESMEKKKKEEERDRWFNEARPMVVQKGLGARRGHGKTEAESICEDNSSKLDGGGSGQRKQETEPQNIEDGQVWRSLLIKYMARSMNGMD